MIYKLLIQLLCKNHIMKYQETILLQYYLKKKDIYIPQELIKEIIKKTYYKYTINIEIIVYCFDDMCDIIRDCRGRIAKIENYKIEFDDSYELREKLLAMGNKIYNNNVSNNPKFMLCMRNYAKIVVIDKGPDNALRIINHLFLEDYLTSAKSIISIEYYPYKNKILPHIS